MSPNNSAASVDKPGSAFAQTTAARTGDPGVDEAKITRHVLLITFRADSAGLDLIHRDLFDANAQVVVSALKAVAAFANPASLKFVAKLLGRNDKRVVLEAIRTIGTLKLAVVPKLLFEVYRTTRSDEVRCESLRALAAAAPGDPELLHTIREQALSPLASGELRSCCSILLIQLTGPKKAPDILSGATRSTVETLLGWAIDHPEASGPIVEYGLERYSRLVSSERKLLVPLAAASNLSTAQEIILRGLDDGDLEVRSAAYRALRSEHIDAAHLPRIVDTLSGKTERDYPIEEEALAAIERLEELVGPGAGAGGASFSPLLRQSAELFGQLSAVQNRVGSEAIELGWLILKSRDYLEYYGDEEFRKSLVHYLKGGIYHSADQLLLMLKKTAARVEVRHFDGYKALADIIKNPKRPGTALIVRELNMAKLGKSEPFGCLIRNLALLRLAPAIGRETLTFATRVFTWARKEKLYRLAEAALFVLAKFDPRKVVPIFGELLRLPVESKILAIACARLLKEVDASQFLTPIEALLADGRESHVLLNLVDALRSLDLQATPAVLSGMITLLRGCRDLDVARAAGRYLAVKPVPSLLTRVTEDFDRVDEQHQALVLEAIDSSFQNARPGNTDALSEFLYRFLRTSTGRLRGVAAVLLFRLGDEFAPKVILRLLAEGDNELRAEVVRGLGGIVDKRLIPEVLKLLPEPNAGLHEAIRQTLAAVRDPEDVELIRRFLRGTEGRAEDAGDSPTGDAELKDIDAGIMKERQAFRFEHEFTKALAVMFTDIQGYSAKAQKLTEMQVNALIQDYEAILLPTVEAHRGKLIKRMGDGHMFVFDSPLDAGLAALRLQKALKRFNSYREELLRVVVRVGIHYGQVVQRGGDVFGNNVNIASRLESSAKGGSALVSKSVWERWDGRIHARELGKITVKNISEPIAVYEPYELQIDFPKELDPLQGLRNGHSHFESIERPVERTGGGVSGSSGETAEGPFDPPEHAAAPASPTDEAPAVTVDSETVRYLSGVFGRLDEICTKVESGALAPTALREELGRSWDRFQELVVAGLQESEAG